MGWGCSEHEMDAGSETWRTNLKAMADQQFTDGHPRTWGRDGEICPLCLADLLAQCRVVVTTVLQDPTITKEMRQAVELLELGLKDWPAVSPITYIYNQAVAAARSRA